MVNHKPDRSGWYCDASEEKGGCKRGLAGNSNSANIRYYVCQPCDYHLCDKCVEIKTNTKKETVSYKPTEILIKCKKGHKLVFRKPNNSGWFCDASCEVTILNFYINLRVFI